MGKTFLAALETSRGFTGLAPVELSNVVKRYPRELLPMANRLLAKLNAIDEQKLVTLDAPIPRLKHGESFPVRSLAIFIGSSWRVGRFRWVVTIQIQDKVAEELPTK